MRLWLIRLPEILKQMKDKSSDTAIKIAARRDVLSVLKLPDSEIDITPKMSARRISN